MSTQEQRGKTFQALHERDTAFIIPNPWDVGSARLLAILGFEALATTSAGYAFSIGKQDYAVGRDDMLEHVAEIVAATELPVSADLENGFGDDPESVAETIRRAAETGLAGGSIEDSTGRSDDPIYRFEQSVERIAAAAEVVRGLAFPFTLAARCENFLVGRPDLDDTIRRLQAYQEAGADVLYAPWLLRREDITSVVQSVDRPVNVLMGIPGLDLDLDRAGLGEIGVRRISVGSGLARTALGAFLDAAREMQEHGTFGFAGQAVSHRELMAMFAN